jgi:hypothetical protein
MKEKDFVNYVIANNIEKIKQALINRLIDPSLYRNWAIRHSAEYGLIDLFNLFLSDPRVDPSDCSNEAISRASENNHMTIVTILMQDCRVNPADFFNHSVLNAYSKENFDVCLILFKNLKVRESLESTNTLIFKDLCNKEMQKNIYDF